MTKTLSYVLAFSLAVLVAPHAAWAQAGSDKEHAELAKALSEAKVSLGAGLTAGAHVGKPISAQFKVTHEESTKASGIGEFLGAPIVKRQASHEGGQLELTVYTEKNGRFSEVVVDPQSGKVMRFWPISETKNLTAAKRQSAALAKAKVSLDTAVDKAVANAGSTAVSVVPALKNNQPVATITLVKDGKWTTATEKLD